MAPVSRLQPGSEIRAPVRAIIFSSTPARQRFRRLWTIGIPNLYLSRFWSDALPHTKCLDRQGVADLTLVAMERRAVRASSLLMPMT